jgi:hypothetical protein
MSDSELARLLRVTGSRSNAQPGRPSCACCPLSPGVIKAKGRVNGMRSMRHLSAGGSRGRTELLSVLRASCRANPAPPPAELRVRVRGGPLAATRTSDPSLARWRDARVHRPTAARLRRPVSVCAHHFVK